jgi:hypothetical protein
VSQSELQTSTQHAGQLRILKHCFELILLKNSKQGQSMDKSENNVHAIPQWAESGEHFGGD